MRLAAISDQISEDFAEAIQLGSLLGVDAYELRWVRPRATIRPLRIVDLSDDEVLSLAQVAKDHDVQISALSSGLFYGPWADDVSLEGHLERLTRCFRLAEMLATQTIVIRGFLRSDERRNGVCPTGLLDLLGEAAARAQAAGLRLLLRNSPGCYADTGSHTASIVHAVHSPALGISWDPCHAMQAGERALDEGYEWISPYVWDVQAKDQREQEGQGFEYAPLSQGTVAWPELLGALVQDNYQGTITVGSQMEPRLLNTLHSLEALRGLLKMAQTGG